MFAVVRYQIEECLVHAGVVAEFGMKRCGHGSALPHSNRIGSLCGEYFDPFSDVRNLRRADEYHFQRLARGQPSEKFAFTDRAIDLSSVGVAADADIKSSESGLPRILDFGSEENGARTGAERRLELHELLELFESRFAQ